MFKQLLITACLLLPSSAMALKADINDDGRVDLCDLAILAEEWLMTERYGPELVDDGGFALDLMAPSPWTAAGDADIFSGKGEIVGTGSLTQPIDVTVGKTYRIIYTVSGYSNGTLNIHLGSTAGTPRTENGTFTESLVAAGDAQIQFSASSSVLYIDDVSVTEVYDTGILTDIEDWAVTTLSALTDKGTTLFRTVEPWLGQIGMGASGIESFDRHAPFAFVQAQLMRTRREGGYDANIRIELSILIGQNSLQPYICRRGDVTTIGTNRMFEKVFLAFDGAHPGGSIVCDEFYLTDVLTNIEQPKKHGIQLIFEANWIPLTT